MDLAAGKPIDTQGRTVNNNKKDVPSVLLTPVIVTKDNLDEVLVKSGYLKNGAGLQEVSLGRAGARPTNTDFEKSGFDKGHGVRSEERTTTNEANRQTFVMSNVFPQRPELNRGPWLDCERWVEKMCKDSTYEFWIAIGPVYEEGKPTEYLNKKNQTFPIPQWVYKVMVNKKPGQAKLEKIAVLMPNINGNRKLDWKSYIVPVSKVEELKGYKFFPHAH